MLSCCLLDFSVGVGAFIIGMSQISSLFSFSQWIFSNFVAAFVTLICPFKFQGQTVS